MKRRMITTIILGALLVLAACSSGDDDGSAGGDATDAPTTTTVPRPEGPAADLSTEVTGGNGVFIGSPISVDLEDSGYVEHEYAASGTATSYTASGELAGDGRWTFAPDGSAPYQTRVLVRRPSDPEQFSGTVVVEWLNVSGGVDADP
jgi:ABC-type glycerol-3-phosphate transport system substrate-binding protein